MELDFTLNIFEFLGLLLVGLSIFLTRRKPHIVLEKRGEKHFLVNYGDSSFRGGRMTVNSITFNEGFMNEIAKQEVTDIKHDRIQSIINHRYDKVRIPGLTLGGECDITPIIFGANSSGRSPQGTYSAVLDERHNGREEDEFMNFFMNFTEDKAYISKNADLDISINGSRIKECEVTSELRN